MDIVTVYPQAEAAQISSNEPDKIFGLCKTMFLGRQDSNHIYRILFDFPVSMIPNDCIILNATLRIYVLFSWPLTPSNFTPFALTTDWSAATVTWNNQPSFYPGVTGETKLINRANFYDFNITEMVSKWYNNEIPNYGFIIKNDELQDETCKRISTTINSDLSPVVEISYASKSEITIVPTKFVSSIEEIDTDGPYSFSSTIDMSLTKTVTCHIKNLGSESVEVKYQMSPNGIDFVDDCSETRVIPGNGMIWFVPYSFAKYGRIAARNVDPTKTSRIRIWYEAQE